MSEFIYSYSEEEGRGCIHTGVPKGFEPRSAPVEAESWLGAKQALGFELTMTQQRLLNETT